MFISDESGKYLRATQSANGNYTINRNTQPYPIKYNPTNLLDTEFEFATNTKYFSLNRSINYPLDFIKDGAAILRELYFFGKGIAQNAYLTVIEFNGNTNKYEFSYKGKFDFNKKKEHPLSENFTISTVDDSAWGVLSMNDEVEYSIDCSPSNPKAIRVLIDGMKLRNNFTFQTVAAPLTITTADTVNSTIPFVLVNQDGDSTGLITKNQLFQGAGLNFDPTRSIWFFSTQYALTGVKISGSYQFLVNITPDNNDRPPSLSIYYYTSTGQEFLLFKNNGNLVDNKTYSFTYDLSIDLADDEKIFFVQEASSSRITVTPVVTNTVISTLTVIQPAIVWGLRPKDLMQQLVDKATGGRYTIQSDYFTINNKAICLSGDAIRGIPNSRIYSSFYGFYKTFNALKFMALKSVGDNLSMELANEVYKRGDVIIDLGEVIDIEIIPATEYFVNEVAIGSPKQDYRHPSGRLAFNSTNTFSLPFETVKKKLDLITEYNTDCYGIIFLLLDYRGQSTEDNKGDKTVHMLDITDEQSFALQDISTFENINVDNAILEPLIKSPLDYDVITNDTPIIRGIAPVGANVNIYVDGVLFGVTLADADGNWSYQILTPLSSYEFGVDTGEHVIDATYTDDAAPKSTINIVIDTTSLTDIQLTYPQTGDSLYNNKPLIKGVGQKDTIIEIRLDGVLIDTVTCDSSCKWQSQSGIISNGDHIITLNVNADQANFHVDSFVEFPLITYIGSELDGFVLINNLPLIKGVAIPGTVVQIWLNYISYLPIGSAVADANGNWEFQVVPITYPDPFTHIDVVLAPIRNGLSVISTSLVNHTVSINVSGYKLNRPTFSSITGVIDNTVFNVNFSPKRMMLAHGSMFAAMLNQQRQEKIIAQTQGQNGNLSTTLNGVTISENTDIDYSLLGRPIALLENALIKTKTLNTFQKTLYNFNQGGVVKATSRGTDIYMLPIGSMKMSNITSSVQEWKLLMSPEMTYQSLLNLYKNGLTINIMKNSLYHSDYNTLHFVSHDFQKSDKYNFETIYQNWFENRNSAWLLNPEYIQKLQKTEFITDQIISNGLSDISLDMYRCSDIKIIANFPYLPITPAPISLPDVLMETVIDFSAYPEDLYFFTMRVADQIVCISEKIHLKTKWNNTILIEASNSLNLTGCFFSTGFKSIMRVEGLVKKLQPSVNSIVSKDDVGDTQMLHSIMSRKREIRFGTARGLPDYIYLKIASYLGLDDLLIEGVPYTLGADESINPSEDIPGHPLYYYNVIMDLKNNVSGKVFAGSDDADIEGFWIVSDATAFGLPVGSLISIEIKNG